MNLSQYRLDEKLITIFEHLTDEQKIETAIQKYAIEDIESIFTYYELEQHTYAKKLLLKKYRNSPQDLYFCARDIIGGRWPDAEPMIMTFPAYAYFYSCDVIRGRWPEAEPTIITYPSCIYLYSRHVIKGRWPEAEPNIMNDNFWWNVYLIDVLRI